MRKILVLFVVITLLGTSVSIPASAAVKAGAKCLTKGQIKTSQGKRFTCTKLGKKLVWDKGRLIVSPTPTPSASPAPTPTATTIQKAADVYSGPSELSDNIDSCKIKEVNLNGPRNGRAGPEGALISLPSGFPVVKPATQRIGTVKWALIPIDFSDLKGESSFRSRVDSQMEFLTEWYFTVSDGNFKVDWSVHNNWVTLPKPSSQYAINNSVNLRDSVIGQALFRDAMASADPVFDFTNIQYVIFLLPKGQSFLQETSQGFPWDQLVINTRTNEGKVSGFAIPGVFMDQIGREYWSYWAHEFGHAISLAHVGRSRGSLPPFSPFDIMGSQDGSTRELSGWLRFVAEWLPDEKVYCKKFENLNSQSLTIVPLNSKSEGLKMAVVPVSTSKAIVIESRRFTKFSCGIPTKNGVLVYVYDANLSHGEDFLMPVYPTGRLKENHNSSAVPCNSEPFADPLLYQGDRVTIEGMSVEVLTHGNFDHIKISKLK